MYLIRVLLLVGVLLSFGETAAPDDMGCGLIEADVEGGCFLFHAPDGQLYRLDNYGAFVPGDIVRVNGRHATIGDIAAGLCPWCGTFQYSCILDVQISACNPYDNCCSGRVGDANGSGQEIPTIGDIAVMIDARFITGICIASGPGANIRCLLEADFNQSGGCHPTCEDITISDMSGMIDAMFVCEWFTVPFQCYPECLVCP